LDAYREQHATQFDCDITRMLEDVQSRQGIPLETQIANALTSLPPSEDLSE